MENTKKQKIDKIFLNIICIVIVISAVFVGSPLSNNYLILSVTINLISFIYICIKFAVNPKKSLIDNFVSIAVLLLAISSCIPVIFKKYISLSDSVNTILIYISLISAFFMIKEIENTNKKKYISHAIIISALIICIIGIDDLTYNFLGDVLLKLGNLIFVNEDKRMIANFGYANSFALYVLIAFMLTFNKYKKSQSEKKKLLYFTTMTIFMICILLSYSRGTWICFAICAVINIFLNEKRQEKTIQIVALLTITIISLVFVAIYNKLYTSDEYIIIYLYLFITLLVSCLLQLILSKIEMKIMNINYKYAIISIVIIICLGIGALILLLNFTQPLVLFTSIYDDDEYTKDINYNISDDILNIKIDIESHSNLKQDNAYEILIEEKNKYNVAIEEYTILLNNESGTKEISLTKQEDTEYLTITFKSLYKSERRGLIINSITINDKNIVVDYKYLPIKIVDKIKNMNMNNYSIWERFSFVKDGIKIIKQNWIFGLGGNAWEYVQYNAQEYRHTAKEVHSYPIEMWMEFGIVGFLAYLYIVFYVIKSIKEKEKKDYAIILLTVILHSCLDFDMSFYITQLIFFVMLACNSTKEEGKMFSNLKSQYIVFITILVGLIFNILYFSSEVIYKINVDKQENSILEAQKCIQIYPLNVDARKYIIENGTEEEKIEEIQWWIKNEKYRDENFLLSSLADDIDFKSEKKEEKLGLIYQIIEKDDKRDLYNVEKNIKKYQILKEILLKIDNSEKEKLEKIIDKEKENLRTIIQDKNARLSKEEKEYYLGVIDKN